MHTFCASFPPIADEKTRVLVLGSMPGAASLAAGEYYAHPRNAFWPILFALWGLPPQEDYQKKVAHALAHRVAIWDVVKQCHREGSGDASIRGAQINDFGAFFMRHPQIHTVFFNGRLAESVFRRYGKEAAGNRSLVPLPSTSPAYTLPFERKMEAWRAVRLAADS